MCKRYIFIVVIALYTLPTYTKELVKLPLSIFDLINTRDLVFDVGAHIGEKTALYLEKGAQIVCIEPQSDCYQKLYNRFGGNPSVTIEQLGLGDRIGNLELFICSSSNTISTCSKEYKKTSRHSQRGYTWDKSATVPITTMDKMIKKYGIPKFCKIDVENFEYEVLKGLSQPIPLISIEFHVELFQYTILCLDYLESLGYSDFNFAAGEKPNFVLRSWKSKNVLLKEILNYSLSYYHQEKDPLWGDIYAYYHAT